MVSFDIVVGNNSPEREPIHNAPASLGLGNVDRAVATQLRPYGWATTMTTGSAGRNPFKNPLAGRYGDVGELMASLTDDEMLEYIRNLNWSREMQTNSYGSWWIGKQVRAGERELDRRCVDPYRWRNACTPEKYGHEPDTSR